MIVGLHIPTLIKGFCFCKLGWSESIPTKDQSIERDFYITHWNLGPYQEYRCMYCGNMAFLNAIDGIFSVELTRTSRPLYDHVEQAKYYSQMKG